MKPRSYSSDAPFPLGPQNHDGQRCGHRAAGLIDPAGSWRPDTAFPPGGRPHLPLPAPRLQHRGARRRVEADSDPSPGQPTRRVAGRIGRASCVLHDGSSNAPTSGSVVTTPDILARHASATVPPQLIKHSPVSTHLSNDGQLGIHMFHVKPWADTITFGTVSDTLSSPRVIGSPMSATVFHVKHDRRPSTSPHQWLFSGDDGGAETLSVSAPPLSLLNSH